MDLTEYRNSRSEQERINDILAIIPKYGGSVLDVGARDAYISIRLAQYYQKVTALDLQKPNIQHDRVFCVKGDITDLDFPNNYFDLITCNEVLEHINENYIKKACDELTRVAKKNVLIGVPYKQDTRVGQTTCYGCGKINAAWGHVNQFDESRLINLFCNMEVEKISFVGINNEKTNFLSAFLMNLSGNPYGTYTQEESCVHCGAKLIYPPTRNILKKCYSKLGSYLRKMQEPFNTYYPNWIHILFNKRDGI